MITRDSVNWELGSGKSENTTPNPPNTNLPITNLPTTSLPISNPQSLFASFGVMGGFMQPQGHLQVASALIDDHLDPQAALDRPRFCIADGIAGGGVKIEQGIADAVVSQLAEMGHPVEMVSGYARSIFGRGQVIIRDEENGVLWGGSDPRADGCAMGL